jgi:response regulator NasT
LSDDLRVLIADFDPSRSAMLERRLAGWTVGHAAAADDLADAVASFAADVVVACLRSPDHRALDGLRNALAAKPLPVVLFVDSHDPDFMEAAIAAGIGSYNVVGGALPDVKPIVRSALALFRRSRLIEEELAAAQAVLAEGALIDRAKARLIRRYRLSEPEAYGLLRRRAMNEGRRIAEIARDILTGEDEGAVPRDCAPG